MKDHNSDGEEDQIEMRTTDDIAIEDDETKGKEVVEVSNEDRMREQLENTPVIPDSECSPAAVWFQTHEQQDDINMYEEK